MMSLSLRSLAAAAQKRAGAARASGTLAAAANAQGNNRGKNAKTGASG